MQVWRRNNVVLSLSFLLLLVGGYWLYFGSHAEKTSLDWSYIALQQENPTEQFEFIDNDKIRLGIGLHWGGAITHVSESGASSTNLVNRHDPGRLITQSYYGAGDYGSDFGSWGYNPVQGGTGQHGSDILAFYKGDQWMYVKTSAMDFLLDGVRTRSFMENWYSLHDDRIHVVARFTNLDHPAGPIRPQELPPIFTIAQLSQTVRYEGDQPFGNGELTTVTHGWPNQVGYQTEGWGAHVNHQGFGLGWYTPHLYESTNYTFQGDGSTGDTGDKTTYTSPVYSMSIFPYEVYQFEYDLFVGDDVAKLARDYAYRMRDTTGSTWNFEVPHYRQGWSLAIANDEDGPEDGAWQFTMQSGLKQKLHAPPVTIPDAQSEFEAVIRNYVGAKTLRLSWSVIGENNKSGTFPMYEVTIPLDPNVSEQTVRYDLSNHPHWTRATHLIDLEFKAEQDGVFEIASIAFRNATDQQPPVLSQVKHQVWNANIADVSFSTDEKTSAMVVYGEQADRLEEHTPNVMTLRKQHRIHLSQLKPDTTYYYQIITQDANGNRTRGEVAKFHTNRLGTDRIGLIQATMPTDFLYTGQSNKIFLRTMMDNGETPTDIVYKQIAYNSIMSEFADVRADGQVNGKKPGQTLLQVEATYKGQTILDHMVINIKSADELQPPSRQQQIEWTFPNAMSEWKDPNQLRMVRQDDSVLLTITGADPYIFSPTKLNLDAKANQLEIRLKNNTKETSASLFFVTTDQTLFDGDKMVNFKIEPHSGWQTIRVDLRQNTAWRGIISQVRFDPAETMESGTIEVAWIKISDQ